MSRTTLLGAVVLTATAIAAPAAAQQSTLSLNVGTFQVQRIEDRVAGDTIVANLFADPPYALGYRVSDFDNVTVGGDWLFPIGDFFEGGVGVNYYAHTVPSFYTDLTDANGGDITQNLRLREVPITASIRFIPTGRHFPIQPYIGVGVSVIPWRYSEVGDFVDTSQNIFTADYHDSGVAVGPVVMAGLRVPVADAFSLGGEVRYMKADAPLDPTVGFLGDRIDLGGISYLATFNFRF